MKRSGSKRVYRGGGWDSTAYYARVSVRNSISPDFRNGNLGFRMIRGVR